MKHWSLFPQSVMRQVGHTGDKSTQGNKQTGGSVLTLVGGVVLGIVESFLRVRVQAAQTDAGEKTYLF